MTHHRFQGSGRALQPALFGLVAAALAGCAADAGAPPPPLMIGAAAGGALSDAPAAAGNTVAGAAVDLTSSGQAGAAGPAPSQGEQGGSGGVEPVIVAGAATTSDVTNGGSAASGAAAASPTVTPSAGSSAVAAAGAVTTASEDPAFAEDEVLLDPIDDVMPPSNDEDCDSELEVTYRDFDETHPDFEMNFSGDVVRMGLVESTLGADGKPVFRDSVGLAPTHDDPDIPDTSWTPTGSAITSAETFADWYHTVDGVNFEFERILSLTETPAGSGVYVYDSTAFFPLGPDEGYGAFRNDKNFLFTTEIHLLFTYVAGQTFRFRGDDDLWIFINDTLALDRGSMHRADDGEGTIDFDAQAEVLGIAPGGLYAMDVFHAERHTSESNFRIETNIGCFQPAPPRIQ